MHSRLFVIRFLERWEEISFECAVDVLHDPNTWMGNVCRELPKGALAQFGIGTTEYGYSAVKVWLRIASYRNRPKTRLHIVLVI